MMALLEVPHKFQTLIRRVRISLSVTALIFLTITLISIKVDSLYYLLAVIIILVAEILFLNSLYYGLKIEDAGGNEKVI